MILVYLNTLQYNTKFLGGGMAWLYVLFLKAAPGLFSPYNSLKFFNSLFSRLFADQLIVVRNVQVRVCISV